MNGVSTIMKHLSRLRQLTDELNEAELYHLKAEKVGNYGHWVWNIKRSTLKWSPQIYEIFGIDASEFGATYEAFLECVHPDDREFVEEQVNNALKGNKYSIDHRIVRLSDGKERLVHEQGEVEFNGDGLPTVMVGIVTDVTFWGTNGGEK